MPPSGRGATFGMMRGTERVTLAIAGAGHDRGRWNDARRSLTKVDGVRTVFVNPRTEMAYVEYDPRLSDPALIVARLERAGLVVVDVQRR